MYIVDIHASATSMRLCKHVCENFEIILRITSLHITIILMNHILESSFLADGIILRCWSFTEYVQTWTNRSRLTPTCPSLTTSQSTAFYTEKQSQVFMPTQKRITETYRQVDDVFKLINIESIWAKQTKAQTHLTSIEKSMRRKILHRLSTQISNAATSNAFIAKVHETSIIACIRIYLNALLRSMLLALRKTEIFIFRRRN